MFPGFRSQLDGINSYSGPNYVLNFGTAPYVGWAPTQITSKKGNTLGAANNMVLGSGITLNTPSSNIDCYNNIIIGVSADGGNSVSTGLLNISGSYNLIMMPSGQGYAAGIGATTSWAIGGTPALGAVVLGNFASSAPPGNNSVTIGAGVGVGLNAVCIGGASSCTNSNTVAVGYNCSTGGLQSIGMGYSTQAAANRTVVIGSQSNDNSQNGAIAIGSYSTIDFNGEINLCNAGFAAAGDIHTSTVPLHSYTTNATPSELQSSQGIIATNPGVYMALANNASYAFTVDIVAQTKNGAVDCAMWSTQFLIQRGAAAANTALVGTPTGLTVPMFATSGATSGGWAVAVTADTTNGRPAIKVTGVAATNISWVANVRMTKVGY
jgi:hypothetical protein